MLCGQTAEATSHYAENAREAIKGCYDVVSEEVRRVAAGLGRNGRNGCFLGLVGVVSTLFCCRLLSCFVPGAFVICACWVSSCAGLAFALRLCSTTARLSYSTHRAARFLRVLSRKAFVPSCRVCPQSINIPFFIRSSPFFFAAGVLQVLRAFLCLAHMHSFREDFPKFFRYTAMANDVAASLDRQVGMQAGIDRSSLKRPSRKEMSTVHTVSVFSYLDGSCT